MSWTKWTEVARRRRTIRCTGTGYGAATFGRNVGADRRVNSRAEAFPRTASPVSSKASVRFLGIKDIMKTDIEQVEEIIANSGNNFHCKVLSYLKEKGWTVLISPYYNDNVSDKPREIDLIAEKAFNVTNGFGSYIGSASIKLFIECKFIPQKIVFWFHNKDRIKAEDLVINNTPLRKDNAYTQKHHYLSVEDNDVAKLFASETKKKTENEIIYKAINQSLNAMVSYRNSNTLIPTSPDGRRLNIMTTVTYPVIVCNNFNNLYRVDIDTTNKPANINNNFQLEVNYAYLDPSKNPVSEYFLIDIISFNKIDAFLEVLEGDINSIKGILELTNQSSGLANASR